ncbi:NACHT domain-containing protein [Lentzea sp. NPDC003310]|uniref:NACHT domain-containing protein n=1 Tax=Lentzea sp. NPDC003310 TaxID=3154447 RepID=UPI0033BB5B65
MVNLATDTIELPAWSDQLMWGVLVVLAAATVVFEVRRAPLVTSEDNTSARDRLNEVVDRLAEAVTSQWRDEQERRRLHDPFPLTLRWTTRDTGLIDHWANIRKLPSGKTSGPLNLNGEITKIRETYERVPSGRLVVLGSAGSGKTVLALNLVLDLLHHRRPGDVVPVMFNLSSWNPVSMTFRDWLVDQLLRDHPELGKAGTGAGTLAAELVSRRKVLPVLDGFDEMAAGLHHAAIKALNSNQMTLVVTSRVEEFAAAVRSADVLTAAAAIELSDLKLDDIAAYLPRTAARRPSTGGRLDWDAVLSELRDHPRDDAAANLIAALATPLMVGLARTIYSDTPDANPKDLLDNEELRSQAMVERHLLEAFLPAAYHPASVGESAGSGSPSRYTEAKARRWLTHLARDLTPEITWWKVSSSVHPAVTLGVYATIYAAIFGFFFRPDAAAYLTVVCTALLIVHVLRAPLPAQVHFQMREFMGMMRQEIAKGTQGNLDEALLFGGVVGVGFGFLIAANTLDHGAARGIALGLVCWLAGALAYLATALRPRVLSRSVNTKTVPSPSRMIADDRKCAIFRALAYGLALSVPTYSLFDIRRATEMAVAVTIAFALSGTAWGRWIVIGRFWLPLAGRLPWNLHTFLDDACTRAVLRQTGAVYEFRHAALRDNLAAVSDTCRSHRQTPTV